MLTKKARKWRLHMEYRKKLSRDIVANQEKLHKVYKDVLKGQLQSFSNVGKEMYDILQKKENQNDFERTYDIMNNIYNSWGDYDETINNFFVAAEHFEKIDFKQGYGWAMFTIGGICHEKSEYEKAIKYTKKASETFQEIGYSEGYIKAIQRLALLERNLGKYTKALEVIKSIEDMVEEKEDLLIQEITMASIYRNMGEYEKALQYLEKGKNRYTINGVVLENVDWFEEAIACNFAIKKLEEAKEIIQLYENYVKEKDMKNELLQVYDIYIYYHKEKQEYERAFFYAQEYRMLKAKIVKEENEEKFLSLRVRQEIKVLEKEAEISRLKNVELRKANEALHRLLHNANQGFLTLDANLYIEPYHSIKCNELLGEELIEKSIFQVLSFQEDGMDTNEKIMRTITGNLALGLYNPLRMEVLLQMLPQQLACEEKILAIEYKIIESEDREKLMLILSDITEKVDLEERVKEERNILLMLVEVLTNTNEFIRTINEFITFFEEEIPDFSKLSKDEKIIDLERIYRVVHTYKGTFLIYHMEDTTKHLEKLENKLQLCLTDEEDIDDKINQVVTMMNPKEYLQKDFGIIQEHVQEDLLEKEIIYTVSKEQLSMVYTMLGHASQEEDIQKVMKVIQHFRLRTMKDLLVKYPKKVIAMAERYGKRIHEFRVEGDKIYVFPEYYEKYIDSLIHVFRNAVDHGIEASEDRIAEGKEEIGTISLSVKKKSEKTMIISIADDGAGIDTEKMRKKIVAMGIVTPSIEKNLTEENVYEYIFADRITTRDEVGALSGRGIGMAAVKEETEKIGGKIEVVSTLKKGTQIQFILPIITEEI